MSADKDFPQRLKDARDGAQLALDAAGYLAKQKWGDRRGLSRSTIARLEAGEVAEHEVDPLVIWTLATIYDVTVRSLSPVAADRLGDVVEHASMLRRALAARGHAAA